MITSKPHNNCNDSIQNPEHRTVEVYLRFANSKSLKIKLPTSISVDQLRPKIYELTNVDIQNQILFYNGKELVDGKEVKLKEKAIIHIKNKMENYDNIIVHVILHYPQERNIFKLNFQYTPINTNPDSTIQQLIQNLIDQSHEDIDYRRTKVIECGRFLKLHKTFSQQKIQSYTQIHLIVRRKLKQSQLQNDKEQKLLIESVLKRSFDNQMMARESKTDRILARLDEEYDTEKQEGQPMRNSQITYRKEQCYEIRRSLPNYFSATKASEFWQSQKYVRKELTPLKFSFREYKKYDGPKSVRDCGCKRKMQFYEQPCQHMIQSLARESPKNSASPKESVLKSSKKSKTSMSMIF